MGLQAQWLFDVFPWTGHLSHLDLFSCPFVSCPDRDRTILSLLVWFIHPTLIQYISQNLPTQHVFSCWLHLHQCYWTHTVCFLFDRSSIVFVTWHFRIFSSLLLVNEVSQNRCRSIVFLIFIMHQGRLHISLSLSCLDLVWFLSL